MHEPNLTILSCPHNWWVEAHFANGIVTAICRNKKCQATQQFTFDEWNALGEHALNKPARV